MTILKWFYQIFDKVFAILGLLLFSQAPLFIQDYTHQLQGHVAELQWQIEAVSHLAAQSGKSLEDYIQKFVQNPDLDISRQGELLLSMHERWHRYSEGLFALQHTTSFKRPFIFLQYLDWGILKSTYHSFAIGLTLNLEGIIYALIGFVVGYLIFMMLIQLLKVLIPASN